MRGRFPTVFALAALLVRPTVDVRTEGNVSDDTAPSAPSTLARSAGELYHSGEYRRYEMSSIRISEHPRDGLSGAHGHRAIVQA